MEIWRQIVCDGEAGAERLVSEYGDRLFAAAILLCHDESEAEDLVFRTLDRAIRKISTFRPTGSFFSWLYAIMLNFRRMDARRKRPEAVPPGEMERIQVESGSLECSESPPAVADRSVVREAVRRLSPDAREVVVLRFFGGLSVEEIAVAQGVRTGTVKSRLSRAKDALRAALFDPDPKKEKE
jgi:RNA polymerase sigma-70 factor (ECF subfamily)